MFFEQEKKKVPRESKGHMKGSFNYRGKGVRWRSTLEVIRSEGRKRRTAERQAGS